MLLLHAHLVFVTWAATILGPPLGGAAIAVLGPACTVLTNAVSFLVSAVGIGAIGGTEARPPRAGGHRARDLLEGWRIIAAHPTLRPLFVNTVAVNGLIMAPAPPLAALMLGPLSFPPWQYALAFALPCLGGIVGSRLAHPLVARFGQSTVLRSTGVLRTCWPLGLAAVVPGLPGLVLVIVVQLGLVTCCGIFNPVLATHRLEQLPTTHATRALSAWSISTKVSIAALTAAWAGLAALAGPRLAIAAAGYCCWQHRCYFRNDPHPGTPRRRSRKRAPVEAASATPGQPLGDLPVARTISVEKVGRAILRVGFPGTGRAVIGNGGGVDKAAGRQCT
ncbi:hypothetical protein BKN37_02795 [Mycobacterium talmoniae]|uniref:Uncharacterized protein n=1 Tax=Mycobacterium talmoniae TaxID=1858794 RepID=A0A1S1NJA6_9MYCO|nr:hypothetical protein BKN37_02795 [Mycobacterium talmoniae]